MNAAAAHKAELAEIRELTARARELSEMVESFRAVLLEACVLRAEAQAERAALLSIVRQTGDTRTLVALEQFLAVPFWARAPHAGCA